MPIATNEPVDLLHAEQWLSELETLEARFQEVRRGLAHSHRLATLGTLASVVAHEYNNILTPIISYAQLALANPDNQALAHKALERALAGAERAARISGSLLGFAREGDARPIARVRQVVEESVACLARDPRKDGIVLRLDVPEIDAAMSPLHLQQVLVNLLLNAKQAMRRGGGEIRISAYAEAGRVQLIVADTGPGIPEAVRDRLFEPFVTLRDTESEHGASPAGEAKGTGLGLSICRDLVQQAGGSIEARSTPGRGAAFHLSLPLAPPEAAADAALSDLG